MVCVHQLLTLVHDGILWLGQSIPVIEMLIHRITKLPHKGADPTKELAGKTREKQLDDRMKKEHGLVKKSHDYSILSIQGQVV